MSLSTIAEAAVGRLLGRLARFAVPIFFLAIFAVGAIYHLTVAATTALELSLGIVYARLIVGIVYALLGAACVGYLWFIAQKSAAYEPAPEPAPRHVQLAAVIEALIIGYEASKKRRRGR